MNRVILLLSIAVILASANITYGQLQPGGDVMSYNDGDHVSPLGYLGNGVEDPAIVSIPNNGFVSNEVHKFKMAATSSTLSTNWDTPTTTGDLAAGFSPLSTVQIQPGFYGSELDVNNDGFPENWLRVVPNSYEPSGGGPGIGIVNSEAIVIWRALSTSFTPSELDFWNADASNSSFEFNINNLRFALRNTGNGRDISVILEWSYDEITWTTLDTYDSDFTNNGTGTNDFVNFDVSHNVLLTDFYTEYADWVNEVPGASEPYVYIRLRIDGPGAADRASRRHIAPELWVYRFNYVTEDSGPWIPLLLTDAYIDQGRICRLDTDYAPWSDSTTHLWCKDSAKIQQIPVLVEGNLLGNSDIAPVIRTFDTLGNPSPWFYLTDYHRTACMLEAENAVDLFTSGCINMIDWLANYRGAIPFSGGSGQLICEAGLFYDIFLTSDTANCQTGYIDYFDLYDKTIQMQGYDYAEQDWVYGPYTDIDGSKLPASRNFWVKDDNCLAKFPLSTDVQSVDCEWEPDITLDTSFDEPGDTTSNKTNLGTQLGDNGLPNVPNSEQFSFKSNIVVLGNGGSNPRINAGEALWVQIFNSSGQLITSYPNNGELISLGDAPAGTYFVTDGYQTTTIVKQ